MPPDHNSDMSIYMRWADERKPQHKFVCYKLKHRSIADCHVSMDVEALRV